LFILFQISVVLIDSASQNAITIVINFCDFRFYPYHD